MAEQSQIRDEKTQTISILVVLLCTAASFFWNSKDNSKIPFHRYPQLGKREKKWLIKTDG